MQRFFRCFIAIFALVLFQTTNAATDDTVNFVSLSDIHFNPYANCVVTAACPLIDALREAPVNTWESILAGAQPVAGSYGADTNYPLFKRALAQISKTATDKTRFVVVLGDLIAHEYDQQFLRYSSDKSPIAYRAFVKKTLQFVAQELNQALPQQTVLVATGNNDAYDGDDSYDPTHQFYQDMAEVMSPLIRDEKARVLMQQQSSAGGYYAMDVPTQPNLHVIVLNSVLFSKKGHGEGVDQAASAEMTWLTQELQQNTGKKILIIMHVPVGIDVYASVKKNPVTIVELWKPEYTRQFLAALQQHETQIIGLQAGHFHEDFLQALNQVPVIGTPGISPLFGNNPGFKVLSYSSQTLNLQNYVTYFDDLSHQSGWQQEYDFNAVYQPHCDHCLLVDGINQLTPVGALASQYRAFYAVSRVDAQISKDANWLSYYWCAIHHAAADDYLNCVNTQRVSASL